MHQQPAQRNDHKRLRQQLVLRLHVSIAGALLATLALLLSTASVQADEGEPQVAPPNSEPVDTDKVLAATPHQPIEVARALPRELHAVTGVPDLVVSDVQPLPAASPGDDQIALAPALPLAVVLTIAAALTMAGIAYTLDRNKGSIFVHGADVARIEATLRDWAEEASTWIGERADWLYQQARKHIVLTKSPIGTSTRTQPKTTPVVQAPVVGPMLAAEAKQYEEHIERGWDGITTRLLREGEFQLDQGIRVRLSADGGIVLIVHGVVFPTRWRIGPERLTSKLDTPNAFRNPTTGGRQPARPRQPPTEGTTPQQRPRNNRKPPSDKPPDPPRWPPDLPKLDVPSPEDTITRELERIATQSTQLQQRVGRVAQLSSPEQDALYGEIRQHIAALDTLEATLVKRPNASATLRQRVVASRQLLRELLRDMIMAGAVEPDAPLDSDKPPKMPDLPDLPTILPDGPEPAEQGDVIGIPPPDEMIVIGPDGKPKGPVRRKKRGQSDIISLPPILDPKPGPPAPLEPQAPTATANEPPNDPPTPAPELVVQASQLEDVGAVKSVVQDWSGQWWHWVQNEPETVYLLFSRYDPAKPIGAIRLTDSPNTYALRITDTYPSDTVNPVLLSRAAQIALDRVSGRLEVDPSSQQLAARYVDLGFQAEGTAELRQAVGHLRDAETSNPTTLRLATAQDIRDLIVQGVALPDWALDPQAAGSVLVQRDAQGHISGLVRMVRSDTNWAWRVVLHAVTDMFQLNRQVLLAALEESFARGYRGYLDVVTQNATAREILIGLGFDTSGTGEPHAYHLHLSKASVLVRLLRSETVLHLGYIRAVDVVRRMGARPGIISPERTKTIVPTPFIWLSAAEPLPLSGRNWLDIWAHGTPDGSIVEERPGGEPIYHTARSLAARIRSHPEYNTQRIRLHACNIHQDGSPGLDVFAQELANILGVDVLVTTDILHVGDVHGAHQLIVGPDRNTRTGRYRIVKPETRRL